MMPPERGVRFGEAFFKATLHPLLERFMGPRLAWCNANRCRVEMLFAGARIDDKTHAVSRARSAPRPGSLGQFHIASSGMSEHCDRSCRTRSDMRESPSHIWIGAGRSVLRAGEHRGEILAA